MAAQRTELDSGESLLAAEPGSDRDRGTRDSLGGGAVAIAIATIAAAIFIWWAWKDGAYFGVVFFPGAMIVYALLIVLLIGAPFAGRLDGPARVAMLAIAALAAWTLLSFTWSDSHQGAVEDGERAMLYASMFGLGLWSCGLGGRSYRLPLAALAVSGAVIGVVITVTLAGGTDVASFFHDDATLRFPIGYRNAEAAFLLICLWPIVALAAEGELAWPLRALLIGAATMLLELVVLAQSRGSLPAAAIALTVFIVLSPHRLRAAAYLTLAALPMLPALPTLLNVFQHGQFAGLVPYMRDSARAIALTSLGSVVLTAICVRGLGSRLELGRDRELLISRVLAIGAIVAVVVGATAFVAKRGGPINFIDQRASEFSEVGYPDLSTQGARFGTNVGSNRHDFWRVAWEQAGDNPLAGEGAGSWQFAYLQDRKSTESPKDPHSVEFLFLSELGIVGLALLATFAVAATVAGLRSRRQGSGAAMLAAGSLTSGAYLLIHSSYDWFWHYPAVTAPVIFLLGASAGPALRDRARGPGGWQRWVAVAALVFALAVALPLFLSERYENQAYEHYPKDPATALSDLDRAADLDPYDPQPLFARGVIESQGGRSAAAVASFRDAVDREPVGYAGHYFLARELAQSNLAEARAEVTEAMRLNPLDLKSRALARSLGVKVPKIPK